MEIKGRIYSVLPLVSGTSASGEWYKQDFVIETFDQYPKKVCMSIWGKDKIEQFRLNISSTVTVFFELSSKEWNQKWFTEARVSNISYDEMGGEQHMPTPQVYTQPSNDDLPF